MKKGHFFVYNKAKSISHANDLSKNEASDPKSSIYISASAGTGKTTMLINRVLSLLLSGVEIDKILCITFTTAAANEMLERLKFKLEEWFLAEEKDLKQDLKSIINRVISDKDIQIARNLYGKFLSNIENLKIQTMHSFCFKVLKLANAIESTDEIEMQILDDYKKEQIINTAIENTFLLAKENDEIQSSIDRLFDYYDLSTLLKFIKILINQKDRFVRYQNNYKNFTELVIDIYNFLGTEVGVFEEEIISDYIKGKQDLFCELKQIIEQIFNFETGIQKQKAERIRNWITLDLQNKIKYFENYSLFFLTKEKSQRKNFSTKKFLKKFPNFSDIILNEQLDLENLYEKINSQIIATNTKSFIIFANIILSEYEKIKNASKYLEYSDLIIKTKDLLYNNYSSTALLYQLNMSIEHVLVDESQDLNYIQWEVIKLLISEFFSGISAKNIIRTLFVVGDYKQSVYGFQGAEPKCFKEFANDYMKKSLSNNFSWKKIQINRSFRSSKAILHAVDIVFNSDHARGFIDDFQMVKHESSRQTTGIVKIIPLGVKPKINKERRGWKIPGESTIQNNEKNLIAIKISNLVKQLLNSCKFLDSTQEKIKPEDIMILFRKRSNVQLYLAYECKKNGIPVNEPDRMFLHENLIIQDLLSVCKFLLQPKDDLNLAALLKSPIIGLNEEQLFKIAYDRGTTSLWDRFQNLFPKCADYLKDLKERYVYNSISELFAKILFEDGKFKLIEKRFGHIARFIIDTFLNKVMNYESSYNTGMESFLSWFYNLGLSTIETSNFSNTVKITTVHSAKGLEAPVVIIADASESENLPTESFIWYKGKLLLLTGKNNENKVLKFAKLKMKDDTKAESLRLLYVAMTRAKDELYVIGLDDNNRKENWYQILLHNLPFAVDKYFLKEEVDYNSKDDKANIEYPEFLENAVQNKKQDHQIIQASDKKVLTSESAVLRGKAIHELLYRLPKIPCSQHEEFINIFLINTQYSELFSDDKKLIKNSVLSVLKRFPEIFYGKNNFSEMKLSGAINDQEVHVQIDKILINDDNIEIIEFKSDTNFNEQEILKRYKKQLSVYKSLMQKIYPKHSIFCRILLILHNKLITLNI